MGERFTSTSSEVSDSELQNPPLFPFSFFFSFVKMKSFSYKNIFCISFSRIIDEIYLLRFDSHTLKHVTIIELANHVYMIFFNLTLEFAQLSASLSGR